MESPRIPLPPGQSGPSELDDELLLDEELLELDDELLELDELELLLDEEPLLELEDPLDDEPLLDDPELDELLEELELLDELESESSPVGTPPLVYIMTALKYPRYPGSEN